MEDKIPRLDEKFTWKIENFHDMAEEEDRKYHVSETFTLGCCDWSLSLAMCSTFDGPLGIYLTVVDHELLPAGWRRDVHLSLVLVNQHSRSGSVSHEQRCTFNDEYWGGWYHSHHLSPRSQFLDGTKGFVLEDTMIVEVCLAVHQATPPSKQRPNPSDSYICHPPPDLKLFYLPTDPPDSGDSEPSPRCIPLGPGPSRGSDSESSASSPFEGPSLVSSPFFHLRMKEKLSEAISTISSSAERAGLSPEQWRLLMEFHANFDSFIASYETAEKMTSEIVLATPETEEKEEKVAAVREGPNKAVEGVNSKKRKRILELDDCVSQMGKVKQMQCS